jgi:hypothetical protein
MSPSFQKIELTCVSTVYEGDRQRIECDHEHADLVLHPGDVHDRREATGQLAVTSLSFDYAGYHFACTQNPVDWSVTKQG